KSFPRNQLKLKRSGSSVGYNASLSRWRSRVRVPSGSPFLEVIHVSGHVFFNVENHIFSYFLLILLILNRYFVWECVISIEDFNKQTWKKIFFSFEYRNSLSLKLNSFMINEKIRYN